MGHINSHLAMKLIFPCFMLMALPVLAQEPDSSSALFQMREAERNFASASIMNGCRAAFIENLSDESVIFTNTWVSNGKEFWKNRKNRPIVLKWEPEFMDIAASRDFGISTGPWELQEHRPYTKPIGTGYFVTVWKKQPGGVWQVIFDAGSATPADTANKHSFSFPAGADKNIAVPKNVNADSLSRQLLEREKQMLGAWKNNPKSATYASFLSPHPWLQYNGHLPTTNADTINNRITQLQKTLIWKSVGSGAASSDDLGYTYGFLEIPDGPKTVNGHYVRIWKKQGSGKWTIMLEMMSMD